MSIKISKATNSHEHLLWLIIDYFQWYSMQKNI